MWARNDLTRRLGTDWPIVQAPMAGGISTPALVAAVSNAGALGSFAAGYLAPDAVRDAVREIRRLTRRPFAVSFFAPEEPPAPTAGEVARAAAALRPFRDELGLGPPGPPTGLPALREQLEAALETGFPVLSFTFGLSERLSSRCQTSAGTTSACQIDPGLEDKSLASFPGKNRCPATVRLSHANSPSDR